MAFGTESALRLARQNSGGTASAAASLWIPIISENVVVSNPLLISDTIRGRYEEGPAIQGIVTVQGDTVVRPHPVQMAALLYAACGAISSTALNSAYQHVFSPVETRFDEQLALVPWTIEKYVSVGSAFQYTDSLVNRMSIELVAGQYLRSTVNWVARVASLMAKNTAAFPTGVEWAWNQVSLSLDAAAFTDWESFTLTMDNALAPVAVFDLTRNNKRLLRNGFRTFRITGTSDLPNGLQYDKFIAGSEMALDVTLKGLTISSGNIETLRIQAPNFRYSAWPVGISGPNRITVAFEGTLIYNTGSASSVLFTVINTAANF